MPTKRRKIGPRRTDVLTAAQRSHLCCGIYFFDFAGEADRFIDDAHRRRAWQRHRDEILTGWDHPGRRPHALWLYDFGLPPRPWPRGWSWPRPIQSEAEMVHRLLEAGEFDGCSFSGANRIESELCQIEANWLHEIRFTLVGIGRVSPITRPLPTYGTPPWFWREHARHIFAERQAEAARWRAAMDKAT